MTRKRFVKLCMSYGQERDSANLLAYIAQVLGLSYAEALSGRLLEALERLETEMAEKGGAK